MKPEFIQCEFCKIKIPMEACKLAAYNTIIDDKEYIFDISSSVPEEEIMRMTQEYITIKERRFNS